MARFDFLSSSSSSVNELSQDINFLSSFEVSLEHSLEPLLELSLSESEISVTVDFSSDLGVLLLAATWFVFSGF